MRLESNMMCAWSGVRLKLEHRAAFNKSEYLRGHGTPA
jgi:hypothetical protein